MTRRHNDASVKHANSAKAEQVKCDLWNGHHVIGVEVDVRLDDGTTKRTRTNSAAWVLSGHTAVILLEGISGAYALSRVRYVNPLMVAYATPFEPFTPAEGGGR